MEEFINHEMHGLERYIHEQLCAIGSVESANAFASVNASDAFKRATVGTIVHLHPLLDNFGWIHHQIMHNCGSNPGQSIRNSVHVTMCVTG